MCGGVIFILFLLAGKYGFFVWEGEGLVILKKNGVHHGRGLNSHGEMWCVVDIVFSALARCFVK